MKEFETKDLIISNNLVLEALKLISNAGTEVNDGLNGAVNIQNTPVLILIRCYYAKNLIEDSINQVENSLRERIGNEKTNNISAMCKQAGDKLRAETTTFTAEKEL